MMRGEPVVVLLVEDNADHAELVRRSLGRHQLANRLVWLDNGEAALDYLFRRGPYTDPETFPIPHVMLLDLRLPRVDGLEVLRVVKETPSLNRIPVVILSTSSEDRDIARAYEGHANSYLVKPVEFDQFTRMMTDLGFYWLAWNTKPY